MRGIGIAFQPASRLLLFALCAMLFALRLHKLTTRPID